MNYYIKNANIVTEYGIIWDGAMVVEDGRIESYGPMEDIPAPEGAETVDALGLYVGPGFIDIHNHGGGKWKFPENPYEAAEYFLKHGETTVCPTCYMTETKEEHLQAIENVREAMAKGGLVSQAIGGIYMEGPYMSTKYGSNAINMAWPDPIQFEDYKELVDEAGDIVKVWAVAPEREGIDEFVKYCKLVNPDVMISCGHSEAYPWQVRQLKKYGLGMQTHCTNATGIQGDHLDPCCGIKGVGPNEADWIDDDLYAEMISDSIGEHVHPDMQKLIIKVKGVDKVVLITDSGVQEAENPPEKAYIKDLIYNDLGQLCGSKIFLYQACQNVMKHTRCGITECFIMASRNPARVLGIDNDYGTIEEGKVADLVFVTDRMDVKRVMKSGQFVELGE